MLVGLLSGASWFALFCLAHIAWLHWVPTLHIFKVIVRSLACCCLGHLVTILAMNRESLDATHLIPSLSYGYILMATLFILYMPFLYTILTSLSVQTLICLELSPQRVLTIQQLNERFASESLVAGRLKTMLANGYLTEHGGIYRITPKGHFISQFFLWIKALWKLGPGG